MSRLSVFSTDSVNSTTEKLMKEFTQRITANPPGVCPVDIQLAFLKVCHAQTCGKLGKRRGSQGHGCGP